VKSFVKILIWCLLVCALLVGCQGDDDDDNDNDDNDAVDDDSADDDDDATPDDDDDDTSPDDDTLDDDSADDDSVDYTQYVDPFIGTSNDRGQLHPAACVPFGLVKLGPDTTLEGHAGYDFRSNRLNGVSHTRIGGVGCNGAGGSVRFLPSTQTSTLLGTVMDKTTESAAPGYYAVTLNDEQAITVELTASAHVGLHRYTFAQGGTVYVQVTLNRPFADQISAHWGVEGDNLNGWVSAKNVCNEGAYKFYFSAAFSEPFTVADKAAGKAVLRFDLGAQTTLLAKVGLSSVDEAQAQSDRDLEMPGWDFDAVRAQAVAAWNEHLSRIVVAGDEEDKTLFYTLFYRSSLLPVDLAGPSGVYRGTDGETHEEGDFTRYQGWSLWDTYRNKYALLTLVDPERVRDIMHSLVELYVQGKVDWATENEPVPTVRTEHSIALLVDALAKGIGDFGLDEAWDAILLEAENLPTDTPDTVLETAYEHWATAQLATALEDEENAALYGELARAYVETWEDNFKVMGDDADVMHARGLYEGTLWQYRWAVVHDLYGIVEQIGGRAEFLAQLTQFFDEELYNHGNEPDIHAPFLFNYVGAPWRAQALVRDLLVNEVNQWYGTHEKWSRPYHGRIYNAAPAGYIPEMDDDAGTMSAWFVLAAMGLYPVTIGQPIYVLTAPIFASVTLHPGEANEFVVTAQNLSATNVYIQEAYLNDAPLTRAWLTHEEVAAGGELSFVMGDAPNEAWGAAEADAPPAAW